MWHLWNLRCNLDDFYDAIPLCVMCMFSRTSEVESKSQVQILTNLKLQVECHLKTFWASSLHGLDQLNPLIEFVSHPWHPRFTSTNSLFSHVMGIQWSLPSRKKWAKNSFPEYPRAKWIKRIYLLRWAIKILQTLEKSQIEASLEIAWLSLFALNILSSSPDGLFPIRSFISSR